MKFMLTWIVHEDKRNEAIKGFSQMTEADDLADIGENIKLIGRWHDLVGFTGFALFETDDASAISNWILNWNSILDAEIVPVLDDAETRSIGKMRQGN